MPDIFHSAVHAVIIQNSQVLLGRRFNTGWGDGEYFFPAGHVKAFETLQDALTREMDEEIGAAPIFNAHVIKPALVIEHLKDYGAAKPASDRFRHYYEYFYLVQNLEGTPRNLEPDKCDDLRFFPLSSLPSNIHPLALHALQCVTGNIPHSSYGFDNPEFARLHGTTPKVRPALVLAATA